MAHNGHLSNGQLLRDQVRASTLPCCRFDRCRLKRRRQAIVTNVHRTALWIPTLHGLPAECQSLSNLRRETYEVVPLSSRWSAAPFTATLASGDNQPASNIRAAAVYGLERLGSGGILEPSAVTPQQIRCPLGVEALQRVLHTSPPCP